ncbi:hypothetical protein Cantr_00356 [Candida viswanathii]|uniref:Uncharacterized protein n=1 Tax=Candida viswanathii TaxID=5486 RepID=A0A367YF48_9ASCO|nr:hypothetical protein Cantr_00356 [Candida viswanathii]
MGQSFYEKEQRKIKSLIKEPLLELILKFLPHLQPTIQAKDDTWEIVAIELTNLQYSEVLKSQNSAKSRNSLSSSSSAGALAMKKPVTSNVVDEIEAMPQLNGIYVREYFEELFKEFKRTYYFRLSINASETTDGRPRRDMQYVVKDRCDAILYELFKLEYKDLELIAKIGQEKLEANYRKQLDKLYNVTGHDENGVGDEVDDGILDSKELLEKYKKGLSVIKNQLLQDEIVKKDKKLQQLKDENQRLLELNHELLGGRNGGSGCGHP